MGQRSSFERRPRDSYATPYEAVIPLLPHLQPRTQFDEPCCGDGALVDHLERWGHRCIFATDIVPPPGRFIQESCDALETTECGGSCFITNPPWDRKILHPLIERLSAIAPTWLLFDADWGYTRQPAALIQHCRKIVSVGRVKWIPESKMTGEDNCAWYLFDQITQSTTTGPVFFGRTA